MSKQSNQLYQMSRNFGKMAANMRDMEVLMSGDPEAIMARMMNKMMYSQMSKVARKATKRVSKKLK